MDKRRPGKPLKQAIVDASILIKIVLPEKSEADIKKALALFKHFTDKRLTIILPSFWSYEVGNTLIRKLTLELFEEKYKFLLSQPFQIYSFNILENVTIGKFAKLHKVTFYDASYHLLAKFIGSIFITADKNYFQKFKKDKNIALLENFKYNSISKLALDRIP